MFLGGLPRIGIIFESIFLKLYLNMEKTPKIVQMRGTIFISQVIGYSPENEAKFKDILMPDGTVGSIQQLGVPAPGVFTSMPQYGMPWKLGKQLDRPNENLSIVFYPGKIDIIQNLEGNVGTDDVVFLSMCEEKFRFFVNDPDFQVTRLAYCPTHSIAVESPSDARGYWQKILKTTSSNGVPFQNVSISYLLRRISTINGKEVEMNFLHQLSDGVHITNGKKDMNCILFTLDMNTIAEGKYLFAEAELKDFLRSCPKWDMDMIDNIF